MKNLFLSLLLCVGLCGVVSAGPSEPDNCVSEVEVVDLNSVAKQAVELAVTTASETNQKANELGNTVSMTRFQMANSLEYLKANGIAEEALGSLNDACSVVTAALEEVYPAYIKGVTFIQYASLLNDEAQGDSAKLFEAASAFSSANGYFTIVVEELTALEETIEEAKVVAQVLFDSLKPEENEDTIIYQD